MPRAACRSLVDTLLAVAIGFSGAVSGPSARAQSAGAMLADDLIVLSKGQQAKEKERTQTPLGKMPGTGASPFRFQPGSSEKVEEIAPGLREPPFPRPAFGRGVLGSIAGTESGRAMFADILTRPARADQPAPRSTPAPLFGTLELPREDYLGPVDGLTLDQAIDRLLQASYELHSKAFELPQADADILTAGLRANPILFGSADSVPYGRYGPQRSGANDYTFVIVQPLDINGKRSARVHTRCQARNVVEAQYQNAVRLQIDTLYFSFVDALAARQTLRYARSSLDGLNELVRVTQAKFSRDKVAHDEVDRVSIQRDTAEIWVADASSEYRKAKQTLAALLNTPADQADALEIRGSLREDVAPLPPVEQLVHLALDNRPDLRAYRLGVHLASADVTQARRERFEDVFLLYTPYTFTNNAWVGEKSATSWSLGAVVSVPFFNRNQGNIARAQTNVAQSQVDVAGLERQITAEVRRALLDYDASLSARERINREIVPRARHLRDDGFRLYTQGERDVSSYLNAQRDYNDVVRQYRDTAIRHRRSQLQLNTVVGLRLLP